MDSKISKLNELLQVSKRIAVFTGAGISTESGIPDFRGKDGIYNTINKYGHRPEEILSHSFFMENPEVFFKYYRENFAVTNVEPNIAHKSLAMLEKGGKLNGVITQNVDGLHLIAGSKNVYELHGSIYRNYCMKCHCFHRVEHVLEAEGIPYCECGGIIKPDVVLYEEELFEPVIEASVEAVRNADMMIVCGSSLLVYPAAGLVPLFNGSHLVIINMSETPYDRQANLVIHESLGNVFGQLRL